MAKITYEDKVTLIERPNIDAKNKVTAEDMNEIKMVINKNAENAPVFSTSVYKGDGGGAWFHIFDFTIANAGSLIIEGASTYSNLLGRGNFTVMIDSHWGADLTYYMLYGEEKAVVTGDSVRIFSLGGSKYAFWFFMPQYTRYDFKIREIFKDASNENDNIYTSIGTTGTAEGTRVIADDEWTYVSVFTNGWENYGGIWEPARYKLKDGVLYLNGLIRNGSNGIAFTLPAICKPDYQMIFCCMADSGIARVDVTQNGEVKVVGFYSGGQTYVSLNGISFPVKGYI